MVHDPWLQRWLPLIAGHGRRGPVLEIGCGTGEDTVTLLGAGVAVTAFDLSAASVEAARRRAPAATIGVQDVREPFPLADGCAAVVVASLSLHYFAWSQTAELAARIRRVLRPGGVFLCRLNSTEDVHFGAAGHTAIEPHFFDVDGQPKRFFDAADVDRLFGDGWTVLSRVHTTTGKYTLPKALWEVVAQR